MTVTGHPSLMAKFYQRRSGGVSKTLIFSDLVTVAGAVLTALVEAGVLSTDSWPGPALLIIGIITRVLRQTGPVPGPSWEPVTGLEAKRDRLEQLARETRTFVLSYGDKMTPELRADLEAEADRLDNDAAAASREIAGNKPKVSDAEERL